MGKLSKIIAGTALLGLALAPATVLAHVSEEDHAHGGDSRRPDVAQIREQASARAETARTDSEQRTTDIKQQIEERRAQVKQEVCERRQAALTRTLPRSSRGATSVKKSMDTIYSRVVGFYESGQLTVENYEELVGNVETAKANADAAITTIDDYNFELDCDNPQVGQQLDGYRLAVGGARTALKEYKQSLVALISSMRAAASLELGEESSEAGDNQGDANEEGDENE